MTTNEELAAANARNKNVPATTPSAQQDCSDIIHFSMFFDGTGNNLENDNADKKWSNVARLYRSALLLKNATIYPIYLSGVGTPFNGTGANWLDNALIKTQDKVLGRGFGAGGSRRMDFGQNKINDALVEVLKAEATKLNGQTNQYKKDKNNKANNEMAKAINGHRLIKSINLSVCGFSRGAALARAFTNSFIRQCKYIEIDGKSVFSYKGHPVVIEFLGLFDTVPSFGIPAANLDWPWTEKDLEISPHVQKCVHYIAGHELRFSFPVDLIRSHNTYAPNHIEKVYPGVHSDVGGGYLPVTQEVKDHCARIPMRDMMTEAVKAGVKMLAYNEIKKINEPLFNRMFKINPAVEQSYKHYMAVCGATGSVEEQMKKHMKQLYSAWGTMHRQGIKTADVSEQEESIDNAVGHSVVGHVTMAQEVKILEGDKLSTVGIELKQSVFQLPGSLYSQRITPEAWRLKAWHTNTTPEIVGFFKNYIHDSKAGFMYGVEPFSYFVARGITESQRNVLSTAQTWFVTTVTDTIITTAHTAESAYDKASQAVGNTVDYGKQKAAEYAKKAAELKDEVIKSVTDTESALMKGTWPF